MMKEGAPVFNLKSAFPYLIENRFPTYCHQCVVMENGKLSTCGRCIDVPGLCDQCGYFFVAEYTLLFRGNLKIILEMLQNEYDRIFHLYRKPCYCDAPKEKRKLLDAITQYCLDKGYYRSSIWTFSSEPDANYSSMTRDNFLGFGCSATSPFKGQFKINTFDVESYCERIRSGNLATSLTIRFTKRQRMIYWLFWTAYSTRVNARDFEKFDGIYEMTLKGAFTITTMRIFTPCLISTKCGESFEKKHSPHRLSYKLFQLFLHLTL